MHAQEVMTAIKEDKLVVVEKYLNDGGDINWADKNIWSNIENSSFLHNAVYNRKNNIVKYLLEHGVNPNIKGQHGITPLMITSGDVELINHGADLHHKDDLGRTILYYAVEKKNKKLVDFILQKDSKLNDINCRIGDQTILTQLSKWDSTFEDYLREIFITLVNNGANVSNIPLSTRDNCVSSLTHGSTAKIHLASFYLFEAMLKGDIDLFVKLSSVIGKPVVSYFAAYINQRQLTIQEHSEATSHIEKLGLTKILSQEEVNDFTQIVLNIGKVSGKEEFSPFTNAASNNERSLESIMAFMQCHLAKLDIPFTNEELILSSHIGEEQKKNEEYLADRKERYAIAKLEELVKIENSTAVIVSMYYEPAVLMGIREAAAHSQLPDEIKVNCQSLLKRFQTLSPNEKFILEVHKFQTDLALLDFQSGREEAKDCLNDLKKNNELLKQNVEEQARQMNYLTAQIDRLISEVSALKSNLQPGKENQQTKELQNLPSSKPAFFK